jgi:hypothetical protein
VPPAAIGRRGKGARGGTRSLYEVVGAASAAHQRASVIFEICKKQWASGG